MFIADTYFCIPVAAIFDFSLMGSGKKMEAVFICSVGICICVNMNMTQNFDICYIATCTKSISFIRHEPSFETLSFKYHSW